MVRFQRWYRIPTVIAVAVGMVGDGAARGRQLLDLVPVALGLGRPRLVPVPARVEDVRVGRGAVR